MIRILGIALALALAAAIVPQGSAPAEAAKRKAAKAKPGSNVIIPRINAGGTDVNRLGNRNIDVGIYASDDMFVPRKAKNSKNLRTKGSGK